MTFCLLSLSLVGAGSRCFSGARGCSPSPPRCVWGWIGGGLKGLCLGFMYNLPSTPEYRHCPCLQYGRPGVRVCRAGRSGGPKIQRSAFCKQPLPGH